MQHLSLQVVYTAWSTSRYILGMLFSSVATALFYIRTYVDSLRFENVTYNYIICNLTVNISINTINMNEYRLKLDDSCRFCFTEFLKSTGVM